jgi:hypothetical protein
MFQKANKLFGDLLTNPAKTIREREEIDSALLYAVDALKNVAKISKQEKKVVEQAEKVIHIPIEYKDDDLQYDVDETIITNINDNIHIYEKYFSSKKAYFAKYLDDLILDRDKISTQPTIGPDSYNAYTSKNDAEGKGVKTVTTADGLITNNEKDSINIDYESKRALTSIITDLVTNVYLDDKSKYFHFVISCFNLLNQKINEHFNIAKNLKINIILKGGNLLKNIFDKINSVLEFLLVKHNKCLFGKYFTYSDFDFDYQIKKMNESISDAEYNNFRAVIMNIITIFTLLIKLCIVEDKH